MCDGGVPSHNKDPVHVDMAVNDRYLSRSVWVLLVGTGWAVGNALLLGRRLPCIDRGRNGTDFNATMSALM